MITPFPANSPSEARTSVDRRSEKIVEAIRVLITGLSAEEQERLLGEINAMLRPIPAPKAGDVLGAIVRLLPKQKNWTVEDLKHRISAQGVPASPKEIYNALGYLTRKKKIQRIGYGRYVVEGIPVFTSDDLGGQPSRHEIDDT